MKIHAFCIVSHNLGAKFGPCMRVHESQCAQRAAPQALQRPNLDFSTAQGFQEEIFTDILP